MRRLSSWVDERSAPVATTMIVVATGLIYTVISTAMARHGWQSVSDLWNTAGIALAVGHGHWAAVYGSHSQIDSPPGFEFVLAPFVALGHGMGLRTPAEHHYFGFWFALVTVATVLASTVLFALDAIARRWGLSDARRFALSLVSGVGVASAVVFWGHPEDCISLALVLWAATAVEQKGWGGLARAGWLLGFAAALQPVALLAVAPVVARFGWRALPGVASRLAVPSIIVVLPELLTEWARTLHHIVDQPGLPKDGSSTPFSHMARSLGHGMYSGGTLRLVATVAAAGLGWLACRHRHDLHFVLFVMAVAFAIRVALETELLGYYFFPVIAICLLLTIDAGWTRFDWCAVLALACIALGNRREHSIALWWPAILATTVAMISLAYAGTSDPTAGRTGAHRVRRSPAREAPRVTISQVRLLDG